MQRILFYILPILVACGPLAYANDKSSTYQLGTYITSSAVADGTITDNFDCGAETLGSTVCSGGVYANQVIVYRIQVSDGVWFLETMREAEDSDTRKVLGDQPFHFKSEKQNPLDLLKNGDRVLFRVETHKKLLGVETDIFVPFADNPNKEAKFVGTFAPAAAPVKPSPQSDNVRAMCDSHKLSPELEKQFCTPQDSVFTSNDGRFSIQFPDGTVNQNTHAVPLQGSDSTTLYQFWVEADNGNVAYMVGYADYPSNYAKGTPQVFLAKTRDAAVKGKTLSSDVAIDLNGVPGRAFTSADKNYNYTAHQFLAGERLYQLIVVYSSDRLAAHSDTFMNSFRIF